MQPVSVSKLKSSTEEKYICIQLFIIFLFIDFTRKEAYELMQKCIDEIHNRLVINIPKFNIIVIGKNGVEEESTMSAKGMTVKTP